MSTSASSPLPPQRAPAAKVPPAMRWRLRMSTCYTQVANSQKVASVLFCLHLKRSIAHVANENCLDGDQSGGRICLARVVMFGSWVDDAMQGCCRVAFSSASFCFPASAIMQEQEKNKCNMNFLDALAYSCSYFSTFPCVLLVPCSVRSRVAIGTHVVARADS